MAYSFIQFNLGLWILTGIGNNIYLVDLFVFYPLIPVAPVKHVADATSRWLNTEVKMICRKKLDFMSHIANCQLPKTWKQNI